MPKKNTKGGKKFKRGKRQRDVDESTVYMPRATENQLYGLVKSKLGGNRVLLDCSDAKPRQGVIPGRMYKKVWMNPGDVVLCSFDVFGKDNSCNIEHKYSSREASILKAEGAIEFDITTGEENIGVEFTDAPQIAPQRIIPSMDLDDVEYDSEFEEFLGKKKQKDILDKTNDEFPKLDDSVTNENESSINEDNTDEEDEEDEKEKIKPIKKPIHRIKGRDKMNFNKGKKRVIFNG